MPFGEGVVAAGRLLVSGQIAGPSLVVFDLPLSLLPHLGNLIIQLLRMSVPLTPQLSLPLVCSGVYQGLGLLLVFGFLFFDKVFL